MKARFLKKSASSQLRRVMKSRLLLLGCFATAATGYSAAASFAFTTARRTTTPSCTAGKEDPDSDSQPLPWTSSIVEQQANEIAELRRQVAALQADKNDRPIAMQGKRKPRPRNPSKSPAKGPMYRLHGELPSGFDAGPIEQLIERRVSARLKKHFSEADRLQTRVQRMGVKLDDRRRTWSLEPNWHEKQAELAEADEIVGRQQQVLQHEVEKRIKQMFAYWDEDGNGLIDRKEFRLAMQILAIPGGPKKYDATFDAWDSDGNGGLNFKEIRQALLDLQFEQPELLDAAHETVVLLSEAEEE